MYAGLEVFETWSFMLASAVWHMCICLAMFGGRAADDGDNQPFARAMRQWGRFTLKRERDTTRRLAFLQLSPAAEGNALGD